MALNRRRRLQICIFDAWFVVRRFFARPRDSAPLSRFPESQKQPPARLSAVFDLLFKKIFKFFDFFLAWGLTFAANRVL